MTEITSFRAEIETELRRVVGEYEKRREFLNASPDSKDRFFVFRSSEFAASCSTFEAHKAEIARLTDEVKAASFGLLLANAEIERLNAALRFGGSDAP